MVLMIIKETTAFKHPNCGGVILQYSQSGTIIFECDQCGERADDIDRLILRGLVIIRSGPKNPSTSKQKIKDGSQLEGIEY